MTYSNYIQNILNTRGRFGIQEYEIKVRHHIIPKCKGGLDIEENLIDLYPQEHYDAHQLLFEENPSDYKLGCAWRAFQMYKGIEINREKYAELYSNFIKLQQERFTGEGNPHYGVHTNYNSTGFTGHKHNLISKQKMSDNNLWKKLGTSNRAGCKISDKQINALKIGKANKTVEENSEAAKLGWETRRKNGTTNTTNGMHIYNNGEKEIRSFECPEGFVEGQLKNENIFNGYKKMAETNKLRHQRELDNYISTIDIEFYVLMYKDGYTCNYLAQTYNINENYLTKYIKQNGIKRERKYRRPDTAERNKNGKANK